MNSGIIKILINTINELNKKACLLLDQHSSHIINFIKDYTLIKNIELNLYTKFKNLLYNFKT